MEGLGQRGASDPGCDNGQLGGASWPNASAAVGANGGHQTGRGVPAPPARGKQIESGRKSFQIILRSRCLLFDNS
jgi:hypothetical protein